MQPNYLGSLVLAFLLLWPTATTAGFQEGTVRQILLHEPGILMFQIGNEITAAPQCAQATKQWAISLSDPIAKPMLAVLLSAQAQGKVVFVRGYSNTCRDWGDRELPSYVTLVD